MTPKTCVQLAVLVGMLTSSLRAAQQVPPPPQPDQVDVPWIFGLPTRWPLSLAPGETLIQAPPSDGKVAGPNPKPGATEAGRSYKVFALEFKDVPARRQFEAFRWPTVSTFDRFLEVFVAEGDLRTFKDQTQAFKDLIWLDDLKASVAPPPPAPEPRQSRGLPRPPEPIVRGGHRGLTGKGVILAIVDTGVDFRNPDFITVDAKGRPVSRLLYPILKLGRRIALTVLRVPRFPSR